VERETEMGGREGRCSFPFFYILALTEVGRLHSIARVHILDYESGGLIFSLRFSV
jgi:hypothetical protein